MSGHDKHDKHDLQDQEDLVQSTFATDGRDDEAALPAHSAEDEQQAHADAADEQPTAQAQDVALPEPTVEAHDERVEGPWSVRQTYKDKRVLITGSTGFLAKVVVSMILRYHPDIEQLYLLIRPRRDATAQERFLTELVDCDAFKPLHDIYGAALSGFLQEKVTVLPGDITDRYLGLPHDEAQALSSVLDLFINSAGLTNFNPNLENALRINTLSEHNILEFLELGGLRCALMHVSTCFVAGNTQVPTPEVLPAPRIYPAYEELKAEFDVDREIEDCFRLIDYAQHLAKDQEQESMFAQTARERLKKLNLSPEDQQAFSKEVDKARREWIKRYLSQQGRKRAAHWGWPNIYTYTKSMGERLLSKQRGRVNFAIVRPAIIESGEHFPVPGWNEGINTTAPLTYLRYKGHRYYPTREGVSLDIIPVDYVSSAMLSIGAALIQRRAHHVYQLGSSDLNPMPMYRIVELTSLATRKLRQNETKTPEWQKKLFDLLEGRPVDEATFNRRSAPGVRKLLGNVSDAIERSPLKSLGGLGKALSSAQKTVDKLERATGTLEKMFEIFMPFINYNTYTFRARNLGALTATLIPEEQEFYGDRIPGLNWRTYWMDVHIPGLARYVYPNLEDKLRQSTQETYTHQDLVELFEASTANYAHRIALQHHHGKIVERYTYAQLGQHADRAAAFLKSVGVTPQTSVLLISENRPQWAMSYFGILKARAIAVPVDPESNVAKIASLATSSHARVAILSQSIYDRIGAQLEAEFEQLGREILVVTFGQVFALQLTSDAITKTLTQPGLQEESLFEGLDEAKLASLIYTSGTTGTPKGVMLSHTNFTNLLQSMQEVFKISERDGFLSVLPLHHTFEFTCGLLMPIARGSSITYLEELNADELNRALKATPITAMIGVPALWQLLNRRIEQRVNDAPTPVRWLLEQLLRLNRATRARFGVNIGPTIFAAIHRAFGGRIRYFISGGAALPSDLLKSFYGMGFNMYEGYGLTEAAPVLTVNRPDKGLFAGSVGKPLPGVEIQIKNPNDEGIGEVIARGANVMLGYLGRHDETQRALQDGWLHTGDLGKLDRHGNLTIVGRDKDVIVTTGGKNVYPDELEELYGQHPDIEEMSVVGLADEQGAERVAALIRVRAEEDANSAEIAEIKAVVREWIRVEGSRVPAHERIQVLRFWDEELPRTATRKIQRKGVIEILKRLMKAEQSSHDKEEHDAEWIWLDRIVASLSGIDANKIYPSMHLQDELGFDSLMFVELASILDARGYPVGVDTLNRLDTLEQLRELLQEDSQTNRNALVPAKQGTLERVDEYDVPEPLSMLGKQLLFMGQMQSYEKLFNVEVFGQHNLPLHNRNIVVISNHCSHLDMGLVKYALGDYGKEIRALAAADYFYKDKTRKTYFKNFTNLIPIERSGSLEGSLGAANSALKRGEMILVFPEGTRSRDGKLQPFRRGVGYLVSERDVDILPVYLEGTYRAFPKGAKLPNPAARNLKVYIGKPLLASELLKKTQGLNPTDRYQAIADEAQRAVESLRDHGIGGQGVGQRGKANGVALEPIFKTLNDKFGKARIDAEVSYYFSLGNDDDAKWTVIVNADQCAVYPGKPKGGGADCVIKTSPELFRRMIEESYTPSIDEFMNGTIKTNEPALLMRFQSVFGL